MWRITYFQPWIRNLRYRTENHEVNQAQQYRPPQKYLFRLMIIYSNPDFGTTSLDSALQEIVTIHGREFQRYSVNNRIYLCPIDDVSLSATVLGKDMSAARNCWPLQNEIDRLELQQSIFNLVFDNRLIFPPIRNPRRVLDCGYGAGNWALEVAERYPDCQVSWWNPSQERTLDRSSYTLLGNWSRYIAAHATTWFSG